MKTFLGNSIIFICILHTIFGLIFFSTVIVEIFSEGLFNTVNAQPMRESGFWFLFFGFLGFILGFLVDWCENKQIGLPKFFGWSLLALQLLLLCRFQVFGFYLFQLLEQFLSQLVRKF